MTDVPEIDLAEVMRDPYTAYAGIRERSPLARFPVPGFGVMWVVTRHGDARSMLTDPRFEPNEASFMRPDVPADCLPYMRSMLEMSGPEHLRLRRLVAPAFTPRRAADFAPRIERIVERLLPAAGPVDLLEHFAGPLPIEVICELAGIPDADRPRWREYGAAVVLGHGERFGRAIPGVIEGAKAAVAHARSEPRDDLISDLVRAREEDGDRLTESELVTLVWNLVLAGQTPANLIANSVVALLGHPGQLAALRADPALMPRAVEELMRWCGPQLMTIPRYTTEDVEIGGVPVPKGEAVTVSIASANRDPRVFDDPDTFDVTRERTAAHLGFAHGAHFCVGASLARVQTGIALGALLRRFPGLALDGETTPVPDPGTLRMASLPVTLG